MKLAYLFISYPGASQVFLQREVAGLARSGFVIEIHPLLRAGEPTPESVPPGTTLHSFGWWDWWRVGRGLLGEILSCPQRMLRAARVLHKCRPRFAENWRHTILGVIFALSQAEDFRNAGIEHIHAAWATGPATAAMILSEFLGIPYSFGAQAYDLYRHGGDAFLALKMKSAQFVHTTTEINRQELSRRCPESAAKIRLIRRGIDRLAPDKPRQPKGLDQPIHLLSVARLIPKKGHSLQLEAARLLRDQQRPFRLRLVGEGPLREALERQCREWGLEKVVEFCGLLSPQQTQAQYQWADLFWHTGIIDSQGDRDGLPNVVPEAFAHGIAVVSTPIGGVTEAVLHGQTGWILSVMQASELALATAQLMTDFALRERLGQGGRQWVQENFLSERNSELMAQEFMASKKTLPAGFSTDSVG